jgi:thiamine biosynthesis protein ThiS
MPDFTVNGKPRTMPDTPTIGDYLRQIGVNPMAVAVELNGQIVRRDAFESTFIPDGGHLEIVRMMGGG